jgi:hypothetical protein
MSDGAAAVAVQDDGGASWVYVLVWSVFSALCTGLGALPLLFIAPNDHKWIARCNAIAASKKQSKTKRKKKQNKNNLKI